MPIAIRTPIRSHQFRLIFSRRGDSFRGPNGAGSHHRSEPRTNRKVALSQADKQRGRYVRVDPLELEAQATRAIYLEGVAFPLILVRQVFINEDGSIGIRSLVSSDTTLSFNALTTTYHERWEVG